MSVLEIKIYPAMFCSSFWKKVITICKFNLKTFVSHADWLLSLLKERIEYLELLKGRVWFLGQQDWMIS